MSAPLDRLHDFSQPAPPAWTPQTIGWYVVFAIVGLLVVWLVVHAIRRWFANRYRRAALHKLALLPPAQFSALLKSTALAVWPRDRVASLTGVAWLEFLNRTGAGELFAAAPGNRIEEIALQQAALSNEDEQELRRLTAKWVRRHRVQA
jgi:Domain of unknown function (DUF4381)